MQKIFIALGVILGAAALFVNVQADRPAGASGQYHTAPEFFLADATMGGNVLATSSIGAATYTAAQIINNKVIQHTAGGALTVTLPASSTLSGSFIPRPGDTATRYIYGITTAITVAAGTGERIDTASSTKQIAPGGVARLDFIRKSNSDIEVLFTTGI